MQNNNFTIRKTTDPNQLQAIYQLRFAGLITEMGLACSEHARAESALRDEADDTGHIFAATTPDGTLVGTARANLLREGVPSPFDSLLRVLGDEAPPTKALSVTSRLIVSSSQRHSTLAARLAVAVYQHGLENDIHHDAIFVQPLHVDLYCRMGYRTLSVLAIPHPQGTLIPLLLAARDWDYLTRIGSIFRRAPSFGL